MAYQRKTLTPAELSEACRRASLSRKSFRGGRPRCPENENGLKSVRAGALDYEVLKRCAEANGKTIKWAVRVFATLLVVGGTVSPHPHFAPAGWKRV